MTGGETETGQNIFFVAGVEVCEALTMLNGGADYTTTLIKYAADHTLFKERLIGQGVADHYHFRLGEAEAELSGRAIVRSVVVDTETGKMKAIAAEMVDLLSGACFQILFPYTESADGLTLYRSALTKVENIATADEATIFNYFFSGMNSVDSAGELGECMVDESVTLL